MWDNFLKSINAVLPIFLLVVLGYILGKTKLFSKNFYDDAEKFVFKIALPCQIFLSIISGSGNMQISESVDMILFTCIAITVAFLLGLLAVPLLIKDNAARGAVIQNCYRSNLAVLGLPLIGSIAGVQGQFMISMLMPYAVTLFNVYTVIELNIFAPKEAKKSAKKLVFTIVRSAITNPLIISSALGVLFLALGLRIPGEVGFITETLGALSSCTEALVLISLGAGFSVNALRGKLHYSLPSAIYKTLVLPLITVPVAHLVFGFSGAELAVIFITFGAPSAVSSYIMAKNMKSDGEIAGQVLLLSTVICIFTLFAGFFLLGNLGWI